MANYSQEELRDIWKYIRDNRDGDCNAVYGQIEYDMNIIREKKINDEAHKEMMDFAEDYGGCEYFKQKVQNEGEGYFYNSYANISAPFDIYSDYVSDYDCWCGICNGDRTRIDDIRTEIDDMKEELNNCYGNSGYTYEALKRDFNTPEGIESLLKYMFTMGFDDKDFEILEGIFESDECAYENKNAKENVKKYMSETFLNFFEDSAYMKDKYKDADLRKLYDSQDYSFRFNVPFLEFENCFKSDEEWNSEVDDDINLIFTNIFTHFRCKNNKELKDKLKGESILSDEFIKKYFDPKEFYAINYTILKSILESDDCAYENRYTKENVKTYMSATFLNFFEDIAYMKDKYKDADLRKLYDSQEDIFIINVPFFEFENCFKSDEEWKSKVKGDINEIFTHFRCKNKEELKDKLKGESILSDEFIKKYFDPKEIYSINYTILKSILEDC